MHSMVNVGQVQASAMQPAIPCPVVCDVVKDAASDAGQGAFKGMVHAFGDGAVALLKFLSTFWFKIPDPKVASAQTGALDGSIMKLEQNLGFIILLVATLSMLMSLGRMVFSGAYSQSGRELIRLFGIMVASTAAVAAITQLLLEAGNAFSPWIVNQAGKGGSGDGLGTIISGSLKSGQANQMLGMWLLIYLLVMIGSVVQVIFMILRGGALIILVVLQPILAADTASEAGFSRWKRCIGLIIAFALYKPVAAIIYATGIALIKGSPGGSTDGEVMKALYGLTIVVLAALALPAMIKFFVPMAGGMASSAFSGGAALGAMATGAAVVAGGAAMAGAGAGAAGKAGGSNATAGGAKASMNPGSGGGSSSGGSGGPKGGSSGGGRGAESVLPDDDSSTASGDSDQSSGAGAESSSSSSAQRGSNPFVQAGGTRSSGGSSAGGGTRSSGGSSGSSSSAPAGRSTGRVSGGANSASTGSSPAGEASTSAGGASSTAAGGASSTAAGGASSTSRSRVSPHSGNAARGSRAAMGRAGAARAAQRATDGTQRAADEFGDEGTTAGGAQQ